MEKVLELHPGLPILISCGQPNIEEWECIQQPNMAAIPKQFDLARFMHEFAVVSWRRRLLVGSGGLRFVVAAIGAGCGRFEPDTHNPG
jgi:hypothetical protein